MMIIYEVMGKVVLVIFCLFGLLRPQLFAASLDEIKEKSLVILKDGLLSKDESIRNDSISYIGEIGVSDAVVESRLESILSGDESGYVRAAAIHSLSKLRGKKDSAIFKKALNYKGQQAYLVHIAAASALYNLGQKDALTVIEKYLDSSNVTEASEAALSAGDLHNGDVMAILAARLGAKQTMLRVALLESLAKLGYKIPRNEITMLFKEGNVLPALKIMQSIGNTNHERELKDALSSNNPLVRIEAAKVAAASGERNARTLVEQYLKETRSVYSGIIGEDVRIYAMDALSEIGSKGDIVLLTKFLNGRNSRERVAAAGSLLRLLERLRKESKSN